MSDAFARNTDPGTSHGAASSVKAALPFLEAEVLNSLQSAGAEGRTIDELTDVLDLQKVTISPRLAPLVRKKLAVATKARRPGKSGRGQIVWVAAEFYQTLEAVS